MVCARGNRRPLSPSMIILEVMVVAALFPSLFPSRCAAISSRVMGDSHTAPATWTDPDLDRSAAIAREKSETPNGGDSCLYTVTTETGKRFGAGTDSTIGLRISDKDGKEAYFPALDNGNNNFERGDIDIFQVLGTCVGKFCKLILYTDNTGFFPSWYVETVSVSVSASAGRFDKTWQLHQWLPKDDAAASLFLVRDDC